MRIFLLLLCLLPTAVFSNEKECSEINTYDFYTNFNRDLFLDCINYDDGSIIWKQDADGSIPLFKILGSEGPKDNVISALNHIFDTRNKSQWTSDENLWNHLHAIQDKLGRNTMMIGVEDSSNWEILARLIAYNGDVNHWIEERKEYLLDFTSSIDGRENFVALLVAMNAESSEKNLKDEVSDIQAILQKGNWAEKVKSVTDNSYKNDDFDCSGENLIEQIKNLDTEHIEFCASVDADFINDTDREGNSVLHLVAQYKSNPKLIDSILSNYDEENLTTFVSRTNSSGKTALDVAAEHSKEPAMISRLIAWGSDPNLSDESWFSNPLKKTYKTLPLHRAAKRIDGNEGVIMLRLLAGGANAFAQDEKGNTALHLLFKSGRVNSTYVEMILSIQYAQLYLNEIPFLERSKAREIQNNKGATPLLYAVAPEKFPTLSSISVMLKNGASPDTSNELGWTPVLIYAREGKDPDLFALLLKYSKNACEHVITGGKAKGSDVQRFLNENTALKNTKTSAGKYTMNVFKEKCPN